MELTPDNYEDAKRRSALAALHAAARGVFGGREESRMALRSESFARWGVFSSGSELSRKQINELHDWVASQESDYVEQQLRGARR